MPDAVRACWRRSAVGREHARKLGQSSPGSEATARDPWMLQRLLNQRHSDPVFREKGALRGDDIGVMLDDQNFPRAGSSNVGVPVPAKRRRQTQHPPVAKHHLDRRLRADR